MVAGETFGGTLTKSFSSAVLRLPPNGSNVRLAYMLHAAVLALKHCQTPLLLGRPRRWSNDGSNATLAIRRGHWCEDVETCPLI